MPNSDALRNTNKTNAADSPALGVSIQNTADELRQKSPLPPTNLM